MLRRLAALIAALAIARADLDIYTDNALDAGWENWSWGTDLNFAATDIAEGVSSIAITSQAWSALAVKLEGTFTQYAGLSFDVAGANPPVQLYIDSTTSGGTGPTIPFSLLGNFTANAFTTVLVDFSQLPPGGSPLGNDTWDRITFQALGDGATYHLDNIHLVSQIVVTPEFLSAEPLGNNVIAVTTAGAVDLSQVSVILNNSTVSIKSHSTSVPVDAPAKSITYFTLSESFAPGSLTINAGDSVFSFTIPAVQWGSITTAVNTPINPHIYGVNFPTSSQYLKDLGVTMSRWGGNAVTAYNPFGGFTNAGSDWYFENRASDSADDFIATASAGGSATILTVPALDWVAKDATSYSYPATIYPNQSGFDPYNSNAGSGLTPSGAYVTPVPDQSKVYTPWNTTLAKTWLTGLANKPLIVTIDNEIEIASSTHQDMHPVPVDYDEELQRVIEFGTAAKEALPSVLVAAPSTCSWWFYWTSAVGYTDNAAHNNIDWLPWFLAQMQAHDNKTGSRLLDYLDIHFYFQFDSSANDAAAKALRLRGTRGLWDPSYVDESWAGSNLQNHQPNPTALWIIPRMQALIAQNYPGTKLSISEWSSTADTDITGGLVTADVLGIFGRYGVDSATYWATPDEKGPVGLAFWLFRGFGTFFGDLSVQVSMSAPAPQNGNVLGVYAAKDSKTGKVSLVLINKDVVPVSLAISNVPAGTYFMRHFGGLAGIGKWQTTVTFAWDSANFLVVPSYTAVFLGQQ